MTRLLLRLIAGARRALGLPVCSVRICDGWVLEPCGKPMPVDHTWTSPEVLA